MRRFLIPILLAAAGIALAAFMLPAEQAAATDHLANFPDADAPTQQLRPVVIAALCLLPALASLCYCFGDIQSRYVARQFVSLLAITFGALTVIWLLIDFQDNLSELRDSGDFLGTATDLYSARLPEVAVTLLPYSLLLSVLFCLGRLSSSREVIAMIQSGRGILRVCMPFIITGFFAALFCMGLNYRWAPRANAAEKAILDHARGLYATAAKYVQFTNPREPRLWMVDSFPPNYQEGAALKNVRVVEQHDNRQLARILIAETATWDPSTGTWSFTGATLRHIKPDSAPRYERNMPDPYVVKDWRETPAEIIRPGLPAEQLGIPTLTAWLRANPEGSPTPRIRHLTQWHHRFAQPFNCLVVVLLAAPLGLVFSRRGASGGVAIAVFLCAGLLFFGTICLSLGDAGHVAPMLAAWLPNLAFGALALYLFHRRTTGRPIYQTIRRLIPNES